MPTYDGAAGALLVAPVDARPPQLEDVVTEVPPAATHRAAGTVRGQRGAVFITSWGTFEDMLAWLEIGDVAQARCAYLRALNHGQYTCTTDAAVNVRAAAGL